MRTFIFVLFIAASTIVSSKVLAGGGVVLSGCDLFLKKGSFKKRPRSEMDWDTPESECFPPGRMVFKSRFHELSYWWGYASQSTAYCNNLVFLKSGKVVSPETIRHEYIEKPLNINLAVNASFKPKTRPYDFAATAGTMVANHVLDSLGRDALCSQVLKNVGQAGKIAKWVSKAK